MRSPGQLAATAKGGVLASAALSLLASTSQPKIFRALGLSTRGLSRAAKYGERLSVDDGETVAGLAALVDQVQTMVDESGRAGGFSAASWLGAWLFEPLPAVGGACPADLIRTGEGRAIVSQVLSQIQSGAYA